MPRFILIVEDDADIAELLSAVLDAAGYRTASAGNGQVAIDRLTDGIEPDLILLDMTMPVMDGWEFRRAQRRLNGAADIPVVVLTADGNARQKAAALGAAGHLTKPIGIDALLKEVERVCGRSSPDRR